MQKRFVLFAATLILVGCQSGSAPQKTAEAKTAIDPCEGLRE